MFKMLSISPGPKAALAFLVAALALDAQTPTQTRVAASVRAQPAAGVSQDKAAVDQMIRDYIMQHPEVLMESLRRGQERTKAAESQQAREAIVARQAELAGDLVTPAAGNAKSSVTLTFFFDYRCGYCKKVTADLAPLIKPDSPVRVVFKELPILGPESEAASRAALAAAKQGAYVPFHQALMSHQGAFSMEALEEVAREVKLDVARWKADMTGAEVDQAIRANQALAASIGIQATPSFVAGSELAAGALDAKGFAALIGRAAAPSRNIASAQ